MRPGNSERVVLDETGLIKRRGETDCKRWIGAINDTKPVILERDRTDLLGRTRNLNTDLAARRLVELGLRT